MTYIPHYNRRHSQIFTPSNMKLASSASEQNICLNYVCLINDIKPMDNTCIRESYHHRGPMSDPNDEIHQDDHQTIKIERTKALHELIESEKKSQCRDLQIERKESSTSYPLTSGEDSEMSEIDEHPNFLSCDNPNVLKLTKMKWLTEEQDGAPDSRSPSLSPTTSNSNYSNISGEDCSEINDKYLTTILQLDKEHNMFGLSNIAIVGATSKQKRKDEEKPVFHQTAIVQICCGKICCKQKSNSDLPASLKCGGCQSCCLDPCYKKCSIPCITPYCYEPPCTPLCTSCPGGICTCKNFAPTCQTDCKSFGFQIKLNRKPKYDPPIVEMTPRSSSELQKPIAARSCHHFPCCAPPSSCFPYLMPCFWPASTGAPCSNPEQCFHNPPCPPPRKRHRVPFPEQYKCPKKCALGKKGDIECPNETCPGNDRNVELPAPEYGCWDRDKTIKRHRGKRKKHKCECLTPICAGCFVYRPEKRTSDHSNEESSCGNNRK